MATLLFIPLALFARYIVEKCFMGLMIVAIFQSVKIGAHFQSMIGLTSTVTHDLQVNVVDQYILLFGDDVNIYRWG